VLTLQDIQGEVGRWARSEFGDNISDDPGGAHYSYPVGSLAPLLGMIGELGELTQAVLKRMQGRKYLEPDGMSRLREDKKDALADLLIFMCDYATRESIDLTTVLNQAWSVVRRRCRSTYEADKARETAAACDALELKHHARDLAVLVPAPAPESGAGAHPHSSTPHDLAHPSHSWKDPSASQTTCVRCGAYRHLSSGVSPCPAAPPTSAGDASSGAPTHGSGGNDARSE